MIRSGADCGSASAVAGLQVHLGGSADIVLFDTRSALDSVVTNPGANGFSDVATPCFDGSTVCADPEQYLFWDSVHPTLHGHRILGDAFAAAVPEPSTHFLLALGLIVLAMVWRRVAERVRS